MLKTIYFRGFTDFCNYACSYCPFAKKTSSHQLKKDEKQLQKLYTWLKSEAEKTTERFQIMITPYGEGLIHSLYQEYINLLALLPNVDKVGIQTNLSLNEEHLLQNIPKDIAHKWYLWATFHSEFAKIEPFAKKVNLLKEHVNISCGIVANTKNLVEIQSLRSLLKPDIYLWVNAMDSLRNSFSKALIDEIAKIDPLFAYEFYSIRKHNDPEQFKHCSSYENLYIDKERYSHQCFFKRKKNIGEHCHDHGKCNCYLGYSNFKNNPLSFFFEENSPFRIPYKRGFKAVFTDLDGVLIQNGDLRQNENLNQSIDLNKIETLCQSADLNKNNNANNGNEKSLESTLRYLSTKTKLFLATSRSLTSAKKVLGSLFEYFEGGVFSDGAHLFQRRQGQNFEEIIPITKNFSKMFDIDSNSTLRLDTYKNNVLRLTLSKGEYQKKQEMLQHILQDKLKLSPETKLKAMNYEKRVFLQHPDASKQNGISKLLHLNGLCSDEILVISDNVQDIQLLEYFPYSACPIQVKALAPYCRYHINFDQIPLILA